MNPKYKVGDKIIKPSSGCPLLIIGVEDRAMKHGFVEGFRYWVKSNDENGKSYIDPYDMRFYVLDKKLELLNEEK